jgi:hypothetical protein
MTVYPSEPGADTDGNPVRRPSTDGVAVFGFMQPVSAGETTSDGQASSVRYRVFLEPSTPALDAASRLVWAGRTFELVGPALRFADPDEAASYLRAELRGVQV